MLRVNNAPQRHYITTLTKKFREPAIHGISDNTTHITVSIFPGIKKVVPVNYRAWTTKNHVEIACLLPQNSD